ncbi:MAG: hypothetical protein HY554_05655 [Elusimicrobia bacterium]|nr:hypothetical protein [Elusimicrobiota bacterium]
MPSWSPVLAVALAVCEAAAAPAQAWRTTLLPVFARIAQAPPVSRPAAGVEIPSLDVLALELRTLQSSRPSDPEIAAANQAFQDALLAPIVAALEKKGLTPQGLNESHTELVADLLARRAEEVNLEAQTLLPGALAARRLAPERAQALLGRVSRLYRASVFLNGTNRDLVDRAERAVRAAVSSVRAERMIDPKEIAGRLHAELRKGGLGEIASADWMTPEVARTAAALAGTPSRRTRQESPRLRRPASWRPPERSEPVSGAPEAARGDRRRLARHLWARPGPPPNASRRAAYPAVWRIAEEALGLYGERWPDRRFALREDADRLHILESGSERAVLTLLLSHEDDISVFARLSLLPEEQPGYELTQLQSLFRLRRVVRATEIPGFHRIDPSANPDGARAFYSSEEPRPGMRARARMVVMTALNRLNALETGGGNARQGAMLSSKDARLVRDGRTILTASNPRSTNGRVRIVANGLSWRRLASLLRGSGLAVARSRRGKARELELVYAVLEPDAADAVNRRFLVH